MTDKMFKMQPKGMFGNFLYNKLVESDTTIKKFAEDLGVSHETVRNHIRGKVRPKLSVLRVYSETFGVSIGTIMDYIKIDYEDERTTRMTPVGQFGSFLYSACREKDGTFVDASKNLNFPVQTIRKHCSMKMIPHYSTLLIYAQYFNVPITKLINMIEHDRKEMEKKNGY